MRPGRNAVELPARLPKSKLNGIVYISAMKSKPRSVSSQMPQNKPRTRLTDRKRAAILDAAASEFRSRGFDNTSMDGIAAVAAVSKRTVYNHFASKEELFTAIVDELMSRCEAAVEYPFDETKTLEQQLTDIGQSAIEVFASDDSQNLCGSSSLGFFNPLS